MFKVLAALLILAASGCSGDDDGDFGQLPTQMATASPTPTPGPLPGIDPDLQFSMYWHSCPGAPFNCAEYDVTVDATGLVTFDGKAWVEQIGQATQRVSATQLQELVEELDRAELFERPCCTCGSEPPLTDSPSSRFDIRQGEMHTQASHYHGCWQSPDHERITQLVAATVDLLDLCPWIGSEGLARQCTD